MTKVNCSLDVLMITVSEENVNARDSQGWAPIHYAAGFGEIKFIKGLVSLAADLNLYTTETAESKPLTPIIAAIKNGQVGTLNLLLQMEASSELPVDGLAPWMYAIRHKTLAPELTSALIVNGADISKLKGIIESLGSATLTILEVQEELIEKIVSAVNGDADQILKEYLGSDDISVSGNENKKEKIEKETDEFIGVFSDFTSKETYDLWFSDWFLEDSSDSF